MRNAAESPPRGCWSGPSEGHTTSLTNETVFPADDMGGWVDRSHLDALALLDRTAVQGTSHPGD